jgi:hypothetical protein
VKTPRKSIKRKRRHRGQPNVRSKLTTALTRKLCATLATDSISIETACRLNDICRDTFYDWYNRGTAEPDSMYGAFTREVDKAQAKAELANHRAAMVSSAAAILFRRFPSHYPSERQQLELSGKDGGPIAVAVPSIKIFTDGKEMPAFPFLDESQVNESELPIDQPIEESVKKIEIAKSLTGPLTGRLAERGIR